MNEDTQKQAGVLRIRVFIDFWNFSLSLRRADDTFMADWRPIGPTFAREAGRVIDAGSRVSFEGLHVYGSYSPYGNDQKFRNWFSNVLDKMPGVHATLKQRQKVKSPPKCPTCQNEVARCPACNADMRGTQEKGVDTAIVTDMIKLAWVDSYDAAVIVSADQDFVPVAEFLQIRGIKVITVRFLRGGANFHRDAGGASPSPL